MTPTPKPGAAGTRSPAAVRVRPARRSDRPAIWRVDALSFGWTPHWAADPDEDPDLGVWEDDRALLAEVDGEPVGVAAAYGQPLSVPGGADVPTAGTTWVGVLPTHRRRGVLRALMTRHLQDSAARGDVLAALWASEPGIYGRFGYGVAARALRLAIPTPATLDRGPADPPAGAQWTRLVDPAAVRDDLAAVYRAAAARRPGAPVRDRRWWDRVLHDPEHRRDGASERRCLLAGDDQGPHGYALFATTVRFSERGHPDGTLSVHELVSVDAATRSRVWQVLLGHDLIRRVQWWNAPHDEPLLEWLPARPVAADTDQLYVRILDLPVALSSRRYALPVDAVLEVHDTVLPANAGRWRLSAQDAAAVPRCRPTSDPPDLVLDVREAGAALLGARSLEAMAQAGLLAAGDPGMLTAVDRAFRHLPAAWCPHVF